MWEGRAGVGGASGSNVGTCCIGNLIELVDGLLVVGVLAGLGLSTAKPSGLLAVIVGLSAAKSRVLLTLREWVGAEGVVGAGDGVELVGPLPP
jgi:hypothetical protein